MTLKSLVLPLDQLDHTLIDVRRYVSLMAQARRIKSPFTRVAVLYVIEVAYENANDTVFLEHAVAFTEWNDMFRGTLAMFLSDYRSGSVKTDHYVQMWFAHRGIYV